MPAPAAQPNQSLIDGLAVLQALAVANEPVGSREMARRLGLEPTRVNRLLKTLAALGLARQEPDRRYVPGPGMHVLSVQALYGSGLVRRAMPVLSALHQTGLTVALGVLWRAKVCYLFHAGPGRAPAEGWSATGLFPAHHSAVGLPLLATLSATELGELYRDADETPEGGLAALRSQLSQIQADGYVYLSPGGSRRDGAVGVAVGHPAFAGLALAGTISPKQVPQLSARLIEAAKQIGD